MDSPADTPVMHYDIDECSSVFVVSGAAFYRVVYRPCSHGMHVAKKETIKILNYPFCHHPLSERLHAGLPLPGGGFLQHHGGDSGTLASAGLMLYRSPSVQRRE